MAKGQLRSNKEAKKPKKEKPKTTGRHAVGQGRRLSKRSRLGLGGRGFKSGLRDEGIAVSAYVATASFRPSLK